MDFFFEKVFPILLVVWFAFVIIVSVLAAIIGLHLAQQHGLI